MRMADCSRTCNCALRGAAAGRDAVDAGDAGARDDAVGRRGPPADAGAHDDLVGGTGRPLLLWLHGYDEASWAKTTWSVASSPGATA